MVLDSGSSGRSCQIVRETLVNPEQFLELNPTCIQLHSLNAFDFTLRAEKGLDPQSWPLGKIVKHYQPT
jgi:hypothetical protein